MLGLISILTMQWGYRSHKREEAPLSRHVFEERFLTA